MESRLDKIRRHRDTIRTVALRHQARSISLIGSAAREEDHAESDIDFLVDFEPGASLVDLIAIQDELGSLLDCPVGVVSLGGLKDRDDQIRREAIQI